MFHHLLALFGRCWPDAAAQERRKLAVLTFATVDDGMDAIPLAAAPRKPARETGGERVMNIVFSPGLVATVVGLWIYFR